MLHFDSVHVESKHILWALFFSIISLYSLRLFLPAGPAFIWVILFVLIFSVFLIIHLIPKSRRVLAASVICGILFAAMSFLSYEINANGSLDFYPEIILCFLGLCFFFSNLLAGGFSLLLEIDLQNRSDAVSARSASRIAATALLLLVFWLPYLLACYPGNLDSDPLGEIRQQMGMSPLSNHHPVIHQLMIRFCLILGMKIGGIEAGVAVYSILQMIISALVFAFCIDFLIKNHVHRLAVIGVFLFYALYTVNGFYSVTMFKDIPFSCVTLLLSILLIRELRGDYSVPDRRKRIRSLCLIIFLSFLFCTIRNNGYYAFLIGFLFIILFNLKHCKRLVIIFLSVFFLVNGYQFLLFDTLNIPKSSSGEMLGLPLQMLARVVKEEEPDLTDENFTVLKEVIPDYGLLAESYVPDNSDPIKGEPVFFASTFEKDPARYLKSWLRIGLHYPRTYLEAFLFHTQGYWDLNSNYSSITPKIDQPNDFNLSQNSRFESLRFSLIGLHSMLSTRSVLSPLYSIGFMVVLFLFSFALLWVKKQFCYLYPIFLLGVLWLTSMAGPTCLYQYIYGLTVTIPLFLSLALCVPRKS